MSATFRVLATAIAVVLVGSLSSASAATTPVGEAVDAGAVAVTDAYKETKAVTHGDAKTEFTVRPPAGATCPGDSANDQWRVQTFLIPASDDPAAITYGAIGPDPVGNGRYALFGVDTTPFVHQLTVRNPTAGKPGVIAPLPPFSFDVVAGEHIPSGTYRIGVACTYFGATAMYWDTDVVLTESADETVSGFRWRLASAPADVGKSGDGSNRAVVIIVIAIGIATAGLAGALVLSRRRRGTRPIARLSKEPS